MIKIIILYLIIAGIFYYINCENIKIMEFALKIKNPRRRSEVIEDKTQARKDVKFSIVWPLLVLRGLLRGKKDKK